MTRAERMAPITADYLIMVAAFRYALGRRSYMVEHVAAWIGRHVDVMPEGDAKLIIREIDEQAKIGSLGMEMDEAVWRRLQGRLRVALGETADV